jgi:hypothetical protein
MKVDVRLGGAEDDSPGLKRRNKFKALLSKYGNGGGANLD